MLFLNLLVPFLRAPAGHEAPAADIAPLARALGAESEADYPRVVAEALARMARVAERYVGSRDDAFDCAQEAFINAVNGYAAFEGRAAVTSWMHRITINCALQHCRRGSARREVPIDDLLPQFDTEGIIESSFRVGPDSAEEILQRRDARATVRQAIAQLPDSHRLILLMRDIDEMPMEEVAATLEVTVNAAKVRLHRARSALRRLLEPLLAEGRL
ncbi:MAG: RNA polymerase sigma factor [Pseudomonadota bacterium]|nr:RNA polymerase sigma factor [Pseudomonadota bacterium]